MQPGSTITPGETKEESPAVNPPSEQPPVPVEAAESTPEPVPFTPPEQEQNSMPENAEASDVPPTPVVEANEVPPAAPAPQPPTEVPAAPPAPAVHHDTVEWTASEYIAHDKSPMWYAILGVIGVVIAALAFLITQQDWVAPIVTIVVIVLFGVSAARPPRVLKYVIDDDGINVGDKHYAYAMFKSFGVVDEEALSSITLLSTKRFMPPLSIYYPPEQEEKIVEKLGDYLPFEHHKADLLEKLMRQIRF